MHITFCGVRGATPAPGPEFVRYGGHTPCVAIGHADDAPTLVLDGGTGLRVLGALLDGAAFRGTLLIGHCHWDHLQGLPFFLAGDRDDAQVRLLLPRQGEGGPLDLLDRFFSPPFFPIDVRGLQGDWQIEWHDAGQHELEGFSVLSRDLPHPGGRALGARVTDGHSTLAYVVDHGPQLLGRGPDGFGPYHEAALELADGADLLIHDAPYTAAEHPARSSYGHAAMPYALGLAAEAGARRLVLFGHDPGRTDDQLDEIVAGFRESPVPVEAARQGDRIEL